jgi:acetylornithine/succinyldiaminopimelate/putrescine aminotransferase
LRHGAPSHARQAHCRTVTRAGSDKSTFSKNSLSKRAGLATLDVLEREERGRRALRHGEAFREKLRHELAGFDMVKEVRGMGLLKGIEFAPPKKITMRAMFGQVVVIRMYRALELRTLVRSVLNRMGNQKIQAIGEPRRFRFAGLSIYTLHSQPHARAWCFFAGLVLFE